MQREHIYSVNQKVYTKTEGGGRDVLYVQELLKNGEYKLRKSVQAGIDVLEKEFHEEKARERAWIQKVCTGNLFVDLSQINN